MGSGKEMKINIKRAYEDPADEDGRRVLVDRLWPRGLTKLKAHIDLWLKEIGPSTELRKWFGHEPEKWDEFSSRYLEELKGKEDLVDILKQEAREGTLTLIYAARDEEHNEALILKQLIDSST